VTAKHLVLIGLMGAGKTSVGRECARRLGRPFVDTDELVTGLARLSVEEIFAGEGELAFRKLERDVVADVCRSPEALVVACGGGTVVDPENRRALRRAGLVIWLKAPSATLLTRVGDGSSRPLLRGDPEGALTRLGRLRGMTYEAASHAAIDTDGIDVGEVADAVLSVFEEAPA
jgi:shikimate kinase